jgi:3-keto-disaccharide hydrolase
MPKNLVAHGCACVLAAASFLGAQSATSNSAGWKQLFNGHDLTGWKHVGDGSMRVENNLIRTWGKGSGLLYWAGGPVSNCTVRVVYRTTGDYDHSDVFVRVPIEPRELLMPSNYGYQVHIDNHPETSYEDEYHTTGTLYSFTRPLAKPWQPGPGWNTMEIILDGERTVVMLNGVKVTDYIEGDPVPERTLAWEPPRGPRPNEGWIGLENDDGKKHTVYFKEIAIKPLR